jgi:putative flippase GtrA
MIQLRYLIVGIWNTFFGIGIFYLLLELFAGTDYQTVLFICFIIANLQSHFTQRVLVWKSQEHYFPELTRFFAGATGSFFINILLLTISVDFLGYSIFLSQAVLTIVLTVLNYFFQKYAVFKSNNSRVLVWLEHQT